MSQNPDTKQRPDDEGGEGASRSSGKKDKGGLMAKLRTNLLARALGTAPVVAPAAGLAAAAAISAPGPARAQEVQGLTVPDDLSSSPSASSAPATAPPPPKGDKKGGGKGKGPSPDAAEKVRQELEELYALVKPAICEKFDLPATCSPEEVRLAIEAGKEPLNREEVFAYLYTLTGVLVLMGTVLGGIIRSQSKKRQDSQEELLDLQTQLQNLLGRLEKIGIKEGMTTEQIQQAVLNVLRQAHERENQPGSPA